MSRSPHIPKRGPKKETSQPSGATEKRTAQMKEEVLEHLRKSSIIQLACERAGIARATYYKWMNSDKHFAEESAVAISEGRNLVNDMAESQLIKKIKDGSMPAITFWLRHQHGTYADARWRYKDDGQDPLDHRLPDYMLKEISEALTRVGLAGVLKFEEEIRKREEAKEDRKNKD